MSQFKWININVSQPSDYETVLWYCEGGMICTGMYYGEAYCRSLPKNHTMHGLPRKHHGKNGRYTEPAGNGYKVTHWQYLPEAPRVDTDQ